MLRKPPREGVSAKLSKNKLFELPTFLDTATKSLLSIKISTLEIKYLGYSQGVILSYFFKTVISTLLLFPIQNLNTTNTTRRGMFFECAIYQLYLFTFFYC